MILDQFKLDGKTALVTGCKRGIGRAMAVALAEAGADIIGVSSTLEPGSEVEQEVAALGRSFSAYTCDFSDRDALNNFIRQVQADFPAIDILVNNAGTQLRAPAAEFPDEYWNKVIEVNLNAQFILSREIGRAMLGRGAGKIIFTASVMSFQGGITIPGYAASKGGIAQLTMALSNEWAGQGVQVNAIAPGEIETAILSPGTEKLAETIPMRRLGKPEEVAATIYFLCTGPASYVNGAEVHINGGQHV